jgi:hypothetical protein
MCDDDYSTNFFTNAPWISDKNHISGFVWCDFVDTLNSALFAFKTIPSWNRYYFAYIVKFNNEGIKQEEIT